MKYFKESKTLEEAKKEYKKLAMANHPDRGGNEEAMKEINNEYELLTNILSKGDKEAAAAATADVAEFNDVISKIIKLDVDIEILDKWIWVSGNTYPVRAELKAAGFFWASKKQKWAYRSEDAKCHRSRGNTDYSDLQVKYNAKTVKKSTNKSKKYNLGA